VLYVKSIYLPLRHDHTPKTPVLRHAQAATAQHVQGEETEHQPHRKPNQTIQVSSGLPC